MKRMVLIFGGAGAIYVVLALLMGVLPGFALSNLEPTPGLEPLTPLEARGRDVYVANGCSYCHTQQVRPLPQDRIFGRPSAPGDFAYMTPELLGSQRTGPDLTTIGVRQPSAIWQYIHLYNPRAVASRSVMPSFSWLFEVVEKAPAGATVVPLPEAFAPEYGVVVPTPKAEALVAYLLSLKQPPLPGAEGTGGRSTVADRAGAPATAASAAAPPAATAPADASPASGYQYEPDRGEALYTSNCAACHQPTGKGLPGAFPPLEGNAAVNDPDPTRHIQVVLHGLQGEAIDGVTYVSPMTAFGGLLSDTEIADIINHERSSWGNQGTPITPADVAAERAAGE